MNTFDFQTFKTFFLRLLTTTFILFCISAYIYIKRWKRRILKEMGQHHTKIPQDEMIDLSEKCGVPNKVIFQEGKRTVNGHIRNVSSWLPAAGTDGQEKGKPKAVIFISHGYIEHSLSYYCLAHRLVMDGNYAVYGIDHIAHGLSDGTPRSVIPDFKILYSDFIDFVNSIRTSPDYLELPAFLFCHSMGGLVGIMSVNQCKNISAAVFSAPAIVAGPAGASPFGLRCCFPLTRTHTAALLTSCTASIDPAGPAAPLAPEDVTHNKAVIDEMKHDPRRNPSYVTNKSAQELLKLITLAKNEISKITLPFFVFHGEKDEIIYKESSEMMFKYAGTDITQRRYHLFPEAKHEVIHENDPIASECMNMIISYFNEQYDLAVTGTMIKTTSGDEGEVKTDL
jgi:alpha-beta hydrolase superfamily lysophospholipase